MPVLIVQISLQCAQLFEQKLILEFEILSPSESDSEFAEFFMHVIVVVLESSDFAGVKIHIVLGGGIVVDSLLDLCVQSGL